MDNMDVRFAWGDSEFVRGYGTGVCLHGHTMHSREPLSFLPRYLRRVPGIANLVSHYEQPSRGGRQGVDFSRAYWTPPLTPAMALALEQQQIMTLNLLPLVSITDHDDIEAGLALQVTTDHRLAPISVEWTVPYERSILHLGIHNLPPRTARSWMAAMEAYTSAPNETELPELLSELGRIPDVLIVLNHPFWMEEGVEEAAHRWALDRMLKECAALLHALELNGTRAWKENAAAVELALAHSLPLISGGDRHTREPAACINLTGARSFAEFVAEIRDGYSTPLFLPHYREPLALRLLEASWDILRPLPEVPGREHWADRIFYRDEAGTARPLSAVWNGKVPWMLGCTARLLEGFATTRLRLALRPLFAERTEAWQ